MLDGTAVSAAITSAQYPLEQDVTYTVTLRALGSGTLTPWASASVPVHVVPAPVLSWAAAPAPGLLDATWTEVASGATYNLALYRGADVNPVVRQDGMTTGPSPWPPTWTTTAPSRCASPRSTRTW